MQDGYNRVSKKLENTLIIANTFFPQHKRDSAVEAAYYYFEKAKEKLVKYMLLCI